MTRYQNIMLDVIRSSADHMTAEEIYMKCKQIAPKISLATVYRNLAMLAEREMIAKIPINGQPEHFDRNVVRHEHVICKRCGKVVDAFVGDLHSYLEEKTGLSLEGYDLCMRYVCQKCKDRGLS